MILDSKGLAISSETLLLAASIDDDGTHLLSGPLGSGKANSFSFLQMGLKYFNIDILFKSCVTTRVTVLTHAFK